VSPRPALPAAAARQVAKSVQQSMEGEECFGVVCRSVPEPASSATHPRRRPFPPKGLRGGERATARMGWWWWFRHSARFRGGYRHAPCERKMACHSVPLRCTSCHAIFSIVGGGSILAGCSWDFWLRWAQIPCHILLLICRYYVGWCPVRRRFAPFSRFGKSDGSVGGSSAAFGGRSVIAGANNIPNM